MIGIDDIVVGVVGFIVANEVIAGHRGMKNNKKRMARYQLERELVEDRSYNLKKAALVVKSDYPVLYKEKYVPPTIIFRRERKEYLEHHKYLSWLHNVEMEGEIIYGHNVS